MTFRHNCIGLKLTAISAFLAVFTANAQVEPESGIYRKKEDESDKPQKVFVTIGPEFSLTIPTDFGADNELRSGDTSWRVVAQPRFRFGGCVRVDFSRRFSLQTGIYYIGRRYVTEVGKFTDPGQVDTVLFAEGMNYIGYELPIMGLVYVQLGERWFMNNAVGVSVDFYPSSTKLVDESKEFRLFNGRNSWIIPSVRVNIGFEYRSLKSGYFFFGGSFHRPFVPITDMFVERNEPGNIGYQTKELPQSGTYFSIDLKYFFPPGKPNRFTQRSAK